jgi:hypothetical protein
MGCTAPSIVPAYCFPEKKVVMHDGIPLGYFSRYGFRTQTSASHSLQMKLTPALTAAFPPHPAISRQLTVAQQCAPGIKHAPPPGARDRSKPCPAPPLPSHHTACPISSDREESNTVRPKRSGPSSPYLRGRHRRKETGVAILADGHAVSGPLKLKRRQREDHRRSTVVGADDAPVP